MKICLIVDDYMPHSIKAAAKMMHELGVELKIWINEHIFQYPQYQYCMLSHPTLKDNYYE